MLTNALLDTHHGVTRYDRATFDSTDGAATVDEMEKGAGALGIGTPDSIKPFLVLR